MNKLTSMQIQEISSDFRNIARRLCRTDYSQCDANLKRFINYIDSCELISEYITEHNIHIYDIESIMKSRDWLDPFEISSDMNEEISLEYQMLKYAVINFDGDFTRLYGTHFYTSSKSTVNDEMNKFISHVIDPLIDYINDYLHKCYVNAASQEESKTPKSNAITATNSTVVVAGTVEGNISNQVFIDESVKAESLELLKDIQSIAAESCTAELEDINEVLAMIENDISANNKPKKGFITA